MNVSILDQVPIASDQTAQDALKESLKLAQIGEELGYSRYWVAEHHDLPGLACPAPEVVIPYIASQTKKIRIGSGAVLLPHYKPYKIAEIFHLLATLFPNRIDVGLGRAPGGSAEAASALSDNFLQQVYRFPNKVEELLHFLYHTFPTEEEFSKIQASPIPEFEPVPWILGTSKKSAILASKYGLPYAFGQFMSDRNGEAIIQEYIDCFQPGKTSQMPQTIVTISVICAETTVKAEEIAMSTLIWGLQKGKGEGQFVPSIQEALAYKLTQEEQIYLEKMKRKMIIGNPQEVKKALQALQANNKADEIMIVTITHSPMDRIHSYQLIAEVVF